MNKISIDLPIILDPHKFLILLAGLDRTHGEILVPDILRFIEVWRPPDEASLPPMTFRILEDNYGKRLNNLFGFDSEHLSRRNFCAGIRLLKHAYDNNMVTLFDSEKYTKIGKDVLNTENIYPPFYRRELPSGEKVIINPDAPLALESLIGLQEDSNVVPVLGDTEFLNYLNEKSVSGTIRNYHGNLKVDRQTSALLECPKDVSLEEALWFVKNRNMFDSVSEKLKFGIKRRTTAKDIGVMGLKFGGTLVTDIALFGGAPITSASLFSYEVISRIINVIPDEN